MYSEKGCSISRGMEIIKSRDALKQSAWTVSVMRSTTFFKCDKSHNLWSISGWVKGLFYKSNSEGPHVHMTLSTLNGRRFTRGALVCVWDDTSVFIFMEMNHGTLGFMNMYEVCVFFLSSDLNRCQKPPHVTNQSQLIYYSESGWQTCHE